MKEKMQVKDYITAGVILAIYFIGFNIIAGVMVSLSSKMIFISQAVASLILAPLYMLYVAKIQKKWAILVFGAVMVTIVFVMTGGVWPIAFGYIGVMLAEFISRSGNYKSFMKNNLGYVFFSYWSVGLGLLYFIMGEKVLRAAGQSDEQIRWFMANVNTQTLVIGLVAMAVMAFIGGFIGRTMLKKHFERAGIA